MLKGQIEIVVKIQGKRLVPRYVFGPNTALHSGCIRLDKLPSELFTASQSMA